MIKLIYNMFSYGFAIILGLIGFALIILAIYMKIKDLKFRKKGKPVKLKVKNIKELKSEDKNNNKIVRGYYTTFEFIDNGVEREETIKTSKRFKIGSVKHGIFLEDGKSSVLSVEGEGFFFAKGGTIFLTSFGMLIILCASQIIFNFPEKILLHAVLIYFVLFFGIISLISIIPTKSKSKKQSQVNKIYYENANNKEFSSVESNLIRYIPKYSNKKIKNGKIPVGNIIFQLMLIVLGGFVSIIGFVETYHAINIKYFYPSVVGTISDTYTYEVNTDDVKSEFVGVKYTYTINNQNYTLDYKTGKNAALFKYKINKKVKLYYEKDNPNKAVPKTELGTSAVPLVIGLLFVYFGIYNLIDCRKRARLYKTYILMEEKE